MAVGSFPSRAKNFHEQAASSVKHHPFAYYSDIETGASTPRVRRGELRTKSTNAVLPPMGTVSEMEMPKRPHFRPRQRVSILYELGPGGVVQRRPNDNLICAFPFSTVNCEWCPFAVASRCSVINLSCGTAASHSGRWQRAMARCPVGLRRFTVQRAPERCGLFREDRFPRGLAFRARQPGHPGRGSLTGKSAFRIFLSDCRACKRRRQPDGERRGAIPRPTLSRARRRLARLGRLPSGGWIASAAGILHRSEERRGRE